MVLFDNHNHSQFSFDGKKADLYRSAEAAAALGLGGICFTDHCDFFVPEGKAAAEVPVPEQFDIALQQAEADRVQRQLPQICVLKGIEVGMYEECRPQIRKVLDENDFDQVIASVHYIDGTDPYYGGYYEDKDWKRAYGNYLETIFREMTWLGDFDIMGHYDYIARYAPYSQTSILYRDFSDILDEMFRYLIQEGKALEINTKSYQDYNGRTPALDKDILLRYRELGGEIISLGSDSHEESRVGCRLAHYAAFAKSLGFRWTAHYRRRRLVQMPL